MSTLTFGQVLEGLKLNAGFRFRRQAWTGPHDPLFTYYIPKRTIPIPEEQQSQDEDRIRFQTQGHALFAGYRDRQDKSNFILGPWSPQNEDLFADDWEHLPDPEARPQ